jgi:hypothetical protein
MNTTLEEVPLGKLFVLDGAKWLRTGRRTGSLGAAGTERYIYCMRAEGEPDQVSMRPTLEVTWQKEKFRKCREDRIAPWIAVSFWASIFLGLAVLCLIAKWKGW